MRTILATIAILAAGCAGTAAPTLSAAATTPEDASADAALAGDSTARRRADIGDPVDDAADVQPDAPPCDCDDGNPCTIDVCQIDGTCDTDLPPAGTSCPGGVCVKGECMAPDAAVLEFADAGPTLDASVSPDAPDGADAALPDTATQPDVQTQPDIAPDALTDVSQPPDAAPDVGQGDAQAPDTDQPLPDVPPDTAAADVDAAQPAPDAPADMTSPIDVSNPPDTAPDAPPAICGCPGDLVALMGDCSVPASAQVVTKVDSVPGVVGLGYHFADGVSGPKTLGFTLSPGVSVPGDFTIQTWVRITQYVDRAGIATSAQFWDNLQSFGLYATFGPNKGPAVFLCAGDGPFNCPSSIVSDTPLPLGQWAHVAVVRKENMVRLFVAGQPSPSMPFSGNLIDLQGLMWVGTGGWQTGNHDLPGDLDEFRVTPKALYWDAFVPAAACAP